MKKRLGDLRNQRRSRFGCRMLSSTFSRRGGNGSFRLKVQDERGSKKSQDKNNFSKTIHNKEISGDTTTS